MISHRECLLGASSDTFGTSEWSWSDHLGAKSVVGNSTQALVEVATRDSLLGYTHRVSRTCGQAALTQFHFFTQRQQCWRRDAAWSKAEHGANTLYRPN